MADPSHDRDRIIECLSRHRVEYLLVGGIGAQMHGAARPTGDFDSLPATSKENLDRENWLLPGGDEDRAQRLPDKCTIRLQAGDVVRMLTPGGGWGRPPPIVP